MQSARAGRRQPAPRQIVLLSRDTSLVALFAAALSSQDELTVVESVGELAAELSSDTDAVMLDLPAEIRRELYEQVRERYRGRLLMAADHESETREWPADHARRFLIRPFPVAELAKGLRMPIAPVPLPSAEPALAETVETPAPPPPPPPPELVAPARRLSSDEPLWERPPALPAPAPAATALLPDHARRVLLLVAAVVVLVLAAGVAGVAVGRSSARAAPAETFTPSAPAPPTPATTIVNRTLTPSACDAALQDADAAISYLIGHVTDQRLSKALNQFQNDRRACRQVK